MHRLETGARFEKPRHGGAGEESGHAVNRKLLVLDAVLAAAVIYAGLQLHKEWKAARARERARLNRPLPAVKPPAYSPLPPDQPVMATSYANIAEKMLLDKSRNPTVVIEEPPPPPKPPMPPLPVYHGMMNIGPEGPIAILSVNATSAHQAVHPGERIGQFKLLDVSSEEMVLEWEGEVVHKRLDELSARLTAPAAQQAAAEPARTETAPPPPAAPPPAAKSGPGEATQFGFKTCSVNDGNAEGAVVDGYKKVMHATPFGQSCTWEPVGR
jgi:hypothetical protein